MGKKLEDLNTAARTKAAIERIAEDRVHKLIPPARYAVVTAVDTVTRFATAAYPDESGVPGAGFQLRMGGLEPSVGSLIRVAGPIGARYIDDVLTGVVTLNNQTNGAPGQGVPVGGTIGQVLTKDTATDYDTSWQTPAAGGGGGAAAEAQFGFGGLVAPSSEAKSAPYVMAAAITFTKVIVTMSKASSSSYTVKIYRAGTLVSTFTVAAGAGLPANPHTQVVSIAMTADQAVQASIGAAPLATGQNILVVCR